MGEPVTQTRRYHVKKTRIEPYVERPQHRKATMLVKKWVAFRRDGGEELTRDRVMAHVNRHFRLPTEVAEQIVRELGL